MTVPKLRVLLLVFFIALLVPGTVLMVQAYGQFKWEAFHQHQQLAKALAQRIDASFGDLIKREESRAFSDYSFLNVISLNETGSESAAFLQRSPLSNLPIESGIEGLVGYFQVDAQGQLLTPLVPASDANSYGISDGELQQRTVLEEAIRVILSQNQLVKKLPPNSQIVLASPSVSAFQRTEAEQESSFLLDEVESDSALFGRSIVEPSYDEQLYKDQITAGQSSFDQLNSSTRIQQSIASSPSRKVQDLKLDDKYQVAKQAENKKAKLKSLNKTRQARKEKSLVAETLPEFPIEAAEDLSSSLSIISEEIEQPANSENIAQAKNELRIRTFESEVENFEFSLLDSGHLVLFRQAWINNQRYVQGLLLDPEVFLTGLIQSAFNDSTLSSMSQLIVAYQSNVIKTFDTKKVRDTGSSTSETPNDLLYQTRIVAPFSDMELLFSVSTLPLGAGAKVISISASILLLVLVIGFWMFYRLGVKQILLGEQQQNFVSAVSHELKTPLTSIRMYGELLREGWVDEARKKTYYDFIFNESERLSRLINNVLQLARVTKNEQQARRESMTIEKLLDDNLVKIKSQLEPAGFSLQLKIDDDVKQSRINVDGDWLTQILTNLVDNAIKFSSDAEEKLIVLGVRRMANKTILLTIRDFGPGIAKDQMRKIFELFYRSENELTRETVGTGIGLALVHQLVKGMDGDIGLFNCDPGVEFKLNFPEVL